MKRVLITGANGFIGSHLIETFLRSGYHVTAGVRSSSKSKAALNVQCEVAQLDYLNLDSLTHSLHLIQPNVVVHCAGVTVANRVSEYEKGNVITTQNILKALHGYSKTKIILLSSLAARGPGMASLDQPWSEYGKSKLAAEKLVRNSELEWAIIRPTAVYGPNDKAFYPLFMWAKRGVFIQLGSANRKLTFVHVADLCHQVQTAVDESSQITYAWDGKVYSQRELVAAFRQAVGKRGVVISIPSWLFGGVTLAVDLIIRRFFRLPWAYTPEKVKELLAEDWAIPEDQKPATPMINLGAGFAATYKSYFPTLP